MENLSIHSILVTAEEMQQIEQRIFEAGMPVPALMEKVSGRVAERIIQWFCSIPRGQSKGPLTQKSTNKQTRQIGVLAGPGHNGGDSLVVARELHHQGFGVKVYQPFSRCKPLTEQHANYAKSLGIPFVETVAELSGCEVIVDGLFGFGLVRPITDGLAADIEMINQYSVPVFSIDLPSGIHTDTGQVMGTAIKADFTACLGLWKRAFMQETALEYLGKSELITFDIPLADITAVLGEVPAVQRLTNESVIAHLPLHRAPTAHKYKAGHLLLIAGSRQYAGAALLAGLGAMASGVGMLTLVVPESIRLTLLPQLPGALLIGCPETEDGAIASLPDSVNLDKYDAIAFGPGLTPTVPSLLTQVLSTPCPVLLDADGLNLLANNSLADNNPIQQLQARSAPTILTPHVGEFKRLFPDIYAQYSTDLPGRSALEAANASSSTILLKGPRSAIVANQRLWFNPYSTPALARGGSGDVLTGLMGGLLASKVRAKPNDLVSAVLGAVLGAVWWHSQAALFADRQRTVLGVDALSLARSLNPSLAHFSSPLS